MSLVACPFCRELFEKGEAERCPLCGVPLTAFEKLPVSQDAAVNEIALTAPEFAPHPFSDMSRGRGILFAHSAVGIAVFFLTWIKTTLPALHNFTGFEVARRLGWSWGALIAWVILVPTVASRKTLAQLRGARVAAAFLASIPGLTVALLWLFPPHTTMYTLRFTFQFGFWVALANSILALFVAIRLGSQSCL